MLNKKTGTTSDEWRDGGEKQLGKIGDPWARRAAVAVEPEEEGWFVRSGGMQSSRDRFAAVRMESDGGGVYGRRV